MAFRSAYQSVQQVAEHYISNPPQNPTQKNGPGGGATSDKIGPPGPFFQKFGPPVEYWTPRFKMDSVLSEYPHKELIREIKLHWQS